MPAGQYDFGALGKQADGFGLHYLRPCPEVVLRRFEFKVVKRGGASRAAGLNPCERLSGSRKNFVALASGVFDEVFRPGEPGDTQIAETHLDFKQRGEVPLLTVPRGVASLRGRIRSFPVASVLFRTASPARVLF